jgi:hypothetical protein
MTNKYEVHTYIEMKVASFIEAKSEEEAIKLTSGLNDTDFLKHKILDISTIDIRRAFIADS